MKTTSGYRKSERGAVAIIFGLTVVVLFAMGGVVLDLGHLYIAKAELQNAADAAALSGAKELNETSSGIDAAVAKAQAISAKNKYNFSTDVTLALANIEFGRTPDGPWSSVSDAYASPQGKTFIKVDTGLKVLGTYLMRVAGIDTVSTSGVAVAGRFVVDVTPLGVCAIDPLKKTDVISATNELMELGFRRGITYNIPDLGPLGANGDPMFLNPVDAPPTPCAPNHSNIPFTAPFVCQGNSAIGAGSAVCANTGGSYGPLEKALNSRFDLYPGGTACDPTTAPPDSNIKEYDYTLAAGVNAGGPKDWMNPDPNPTQQSISIDATIAKPLNWPANPPAAANFGVLWSYSPAVHATGTAPNYTAGTPFALADWNTLPLYNVGLSADTSATGYPASAAIPPFPAGTVAAPYNQTSGKYFEVPPRNPPGTRNRRLLNIVIVDCNGLSVVGGLARAILPVKGIGRFFMQTHADFTGGGPGGLKKLYAEFAGLIEPAPNSEIKLYR